MSTIKFRLAKPSDAKQIANCHWHVRDRYTHGIFLSLGEKFLCTYYEIMLDDPNEIVVVAENNNGKIVGFASGSLDATSQAKTLRSHKIKLGIAAVCACLYHPSLLKEVWQRYRFLENKSDYQFLYMNGPRSEYLCWRKDDADSINMMILDRIRYKIMAEFGVKEVFIEIDRQNERLFKARERDKSVTLVTEFKLPDGRMRGIFRKSLKKGNL